MLVRTRHTFVTVCKGGKQAGKKAHTKSNLPSKICDVCQRPFEWRKKWSKARPCLRLFLLRLISI
jgi:hypothetical protein